MLECNMYREETAVSDSPTLCTALLLTIANIKRGLRVRLINDRFDLLGHPNLCQCSFPKIGQICTIRDWELPTTGAWGCRLLEIQSPEVFYDIGGYKEICFSFHRFEVVRDGR